MGSSQSWVWNPATSQQQRCAAARLLLCSSIAHLNNYVLPPCLLALAAAGRCWARCRSGLGRWSAAPTHAGKWPKTTGCAPLARSCMPACLRLLTVPALGQVQGDSRGSSRKEARRQAAILQMCSVAARKQANSPARHPWCAGARLPRLSQLHHIYDQGLLLRCAACVDIMLLCTDGPSQCRPCCCSALTCHHYAGVVQLAWRGRVGV